MFARLSANPEGLASIGLKPDLELVPYEALRPEVPDLPGSPGNSTNEDEDDAYATGDCRAGRSSG